MTSWMKTRADRSGADDARPADGIGAVVGADRYCDECPGRNAHTLDCPVGLEIRQRAEADRRRRQQQWDRDMAEMARARKLATRKGRMER